MDKKVQFLFLPLLIGFWGCQNDTEERRAEIRTVAREVAVKVFAEQREALEKEIGRKQQDDLTRALQDAQKVAAELSPWTQLEVKDYKIGVAGLLADRFQLTRLVIINHGSHALSDVTGEVTWVRENNTVAGVVPFTLNRVIPAAADMEFTTEDGTLKNAAIEASVSQVRIRFTGGKVLGGDQ